jgi:serine protease AprX
VRNGGIRKETRSSALWGTGNRGGESRSSALWGKGGRGAITALAAMLVLSVPLAASAPGGGKATKPGKTFITAALDKRADKAPNAKVPVIITADPGFALPKRQLDSLLKAGGIPSQRNLDLLNGYAVTLKANQLKSLENIDGLTITPDAAVHTSGGYTSTQLWPYESGLASTWSGPGSPKPGSVPTIAVIDSGIQQGRTSDFGNRLLGSVNFTSLPNNSAGDGRGHGTFVAGVAAGSAGGYTGATPAANLISLDVMNDAGVARTSDVIAACQWILNNKAKYNIKIANLSLHSGTPSSFTRDPLDKAVEKLWFSGVTVVAAAGNYGTADGPSGVKYAPGNDPFVITVGAADINGTKTLADDTVTSWSAWGYTNDGFAKPEIVAPGRYMVGPVPASSTLTTERADKVTAPGYMQLSGTSFAAPIVSGTAALVLSMHPDFTPDQVKGAIMATAKQLKSAKKGQAGLGELQIDKAALRQVPPNPNRGLNRYVVSDPLNGGSAFDAVSWNSAAKGDVSWNSVSWNDVSWLDDTEADVSWLDVSWSSNVFSDVSWLDVSWLDVSWADSSYEDAAEGDTNSTDPNGYVLTPEQAAEIMADPDLAPDPDTLPADVAAAMPADDGTANAAGATGATGATGASGPTG